MIVLGIETSCDETAVAIVNSDKKILANVLRSQYDEHHKFGGVVPELASRSHIEHLHLIVETAISEAKLTYSELDAVAVTTGPGLIGGVIVGTMLAKGLAFAANKPFIAVNHLEGHTLTARLTNDIPFPFLLLLASGGHCQILIVEEVGKYNLLGSTVDDAVGEAFDKVAKMMGYAYPGGPIIERLALAGDPKAYEFPKPLFRDLNCTFSFSGLKTAVKRAIDSIESITEHDKANIAASFQAAVGDILARKVTNAISVCKDKQIKINKLVIAGGVAANQCLKQRIIAEVSTFGFEVITPPLGLCTDNAAMIAWAGLERLKAGYTSPLDFEPRSRWPLTELLNG